MARAGCCRSAGAMRSTARPKAESASQGSASPAKPMRAVATKGGMPPHQAGEAVNTLLLAEKIARSQPAAVIGPVKQRLALPLTARQIAGLAVLLDLANVAPHRHPALDLPRVLLRQAAPEIIAAIPLEP